MPSDAVRQLLLKKKKRPAVSDDDIYFSYKPPPVDNKKPKPEDSIPDYPQNKKAREFLKKAPIGMPPLGEGVNLNQCWRCKLHGHATGSRECPYFEVGNLEAEAERQIREDPMAQFEKPSVPGQVSRQEKLEELQQLLASVKAAEKERKRKKKEKKKEKKRKKRLKKESHSE